MDEIYTDINDIDEYLDCYHQLIGLNEEHIGGIFRLHQARINKLIREREGHQQQQQQRAMIVDKSGMNWRDAINEVAESEGLELPQPVRAERHRRHTAFDPTLSTLLESSTSSRSREIAEDDIEHEDGNEDGSEDGIELGNAEGNNSCYDGDVDREEDSGAAV
jgi:hypothetical protein